MHEVISSHATSDGWISYVRTPDGVRVYRWLAPGVYEPYGTPNNG